MNYPIRKESKQWNVIMPAYSIEDLILACKETVLVSVFDGAKSGARNDFKLHTTSALLEFIHSGGLEKLEHINTKPWKNKPENIKDIIDVDAYSFYSGTKCGYIAFFYNPQTKKWIIKSFKMNENPNPKFHPFENLKYILNKNTE